MGRLPSSFPEIAGEMFLSCHTIKAQVRSLYRKLAASLRSQAVARSRDLGRSRSEGPGCSLSPL
jgi:LuxR family transcriptional regulator, maltose regulon positive regulatory protein